MRRPSWLSLNLALLLCASPCAAQQIASGKERTVLQDKVARAEAAAAQDSISGGDQEALRAEATALRTRLRDGDFRPGDRITISVAGEPTLSNTFVVGEGKVLDIPTLEPICLQGVLRSELRDVVFREVSRYIKRPEIQVSTPINVGVLGAVGRPGFYSVAPDSPLADALMAAGGVTPNSDIGHSRIVRGTSVFAGPDQFRHLLAKNSTLQDIGLQSGDEVILAEQTHHWQALLPSALGVISAIGTTLILFRHR